MLTYTGKRARHFGQPAVIVHTGGRSVYSERRGEPMYWIACDGYEFGAYASELEVTRTPVVRDDDGNTYAVGDVGTITLPWSEVCMFLRIADARMRFRVVSSDAVQLLNPDGSRFSSAILTSEAGLWRLP